MSFFNRFRLFNPKLNLESLSLSFGNKHLIVYCKYGVKVWFIELENFEYVKSKLFVKLKHKYDYLKNGIGGYLYPFLCPSLSNEQFYFIESCLDFDKHFWYYMSSNNMLHYNPLILDIDAAQTQYKNTAPYLSDSVYSLEKAIKFGFLPELQRKRTISRNEAIRILAQAKLQCSSSPISCTPIRVSCRGDVVERVRSVLPDPMFHDWSIDPNGVEIVDVWDWGLTDL